MDAEWEKIYQTLADRGQSAVLYDTLEEAIHSLLSDGLTSAGLLSDPSEYHYLQERIFFENAHRDGQQDIFLRDMNDDLTRGRSSEKESNVSASEFTRPLNHNQAVALDIMKGVNVILDQMCRHFLLSEPRPESKIEFGNYLRQLENLMADRVRLDRVDFRRQLPRLFFAAATEARRVEQEAAARGREGEGGRT